VPNVWKMANVPPLAKVHPPLSVDSDLRPISRTPTVSKRAIVGGWILEAVADKLDPKPQLIMHLSRCCTTGVLLLIAAVPLD